MAKCEICGKGVQFGCNVSHSNKRVNKMWKANVKKIRLLVNNRAVRTNVCTRCIKTGNIVKAV